MSKFQEKQKKNTGTPNVNLFTSWEFRSYVVFVIGLAFFYFWYLILPASQGIDRSLIDSPFCAEGWHPIGLCGKINNVSKEDNGNYKYSSTFFYNGNEYHCISFSANSQVKKGELVNIEIYKGDVALARIVGMKIVDMWYLHIALFCFFIFLFFVSVIGGYHRTRQSVLFGR
jgi:hypothetical protein